MKQVTQNTEFIIGIDFGHGETSAAFYDLKTQEKKDLSSTYKCNFLGADNKQ